MEKKEHAAISLPLSQRLEYLQNFFSSPPTPSAWSFVLTQKIAWALFERSELVHPHSQFTSARFKKCRAGC